MSYATAPYGPTNDPDTTPAALVTLDGGVYLWYEDEDGYPHLHSRDLAAALRAAVDPVRQWLTDLGTTEDQAEIALDAALDHHASRIMEEAVTTVDDWLLGWATGAGCDELLALSGMALPGVLDWAESQRQYACEVPLPWTVPAHWVIIPCAPLSLTPLVRWSDPDAWDGAHTDPRAYAVHLQRSRLVVVDTDIRDDGDGEQTLQNLATAMGSSLPRTLTTRTPSGGCHRWYRMPEGTTYPRQSAGLVAPHVDIVTGAGRGPGSVRHDGTYEIVDYSQVAECPGWLLQAAEAATAPPAGASQALSRVLSQMRPMNPARRERAAYTVLQRSVQDMLDAAPGTRNAVLNRVVFTCAVVGADPTHITATMTDAAGASGLSETEAASVIERAIAAGRAAREEAQ
ncbi:bifunctional DNA primase/polymerase [Kocuria carniphila]|uniref:bifunctional DNA primase/polymerase n=1 Tax=Kocuria carniphila TaxID=262208 RepID=UPI0034DB7269